MAAPWAAGAQVRIVGQLHGQTTNNVLNFATNTVINDPVALAQLLTQLATAVLACVADQLLTAVTNDWRAIGVEARQISPVSSDPVFVPAAGNAVGAKTATSVSFAATLVHVRTGTGGKSGRGRIFLPPPGEADITLSAIGQTAIDDFQAMIACIAGKFIGVGATEPWRLGVLSRKKTGEPPVLPAFDVRFREALSLDVSTDVAIMGSRRKGRGN